MSYAQDTVVPVERSRGEIEGILARYGATSFMYAVTPGRAMVAFEKHGRHVRMVLPLPAADDKKIRSDGRGHARTPKQVQLAIEKETRLRWRALALVIKAKLEAVGSGIAVFEDEFLAYIVLPNQETLGEWARPQLEAMTRSGKMPLLLPDRVAHG